MGDFVETIGNKGLSLFFDSISYGVRWFISNAFANGYTVRININSSEDIYLNSNNDITVRSGFEPNSSKYNFLLEKGNKKLIASLTFTKLGRYSFPYELNVYTFDIEPLHQENTDEDNGFTNYQEV